MPGIDCLLFSRVTRSRLVCESIESYSTNEIMGNREVVACLLAPSSLNKNNIAKRVEVYSEDLQDRGSTPLGSTIFGSVAQWLEQGTHNSLVVGSIPTIPTNLSTTPMM